MSSENDRREFLRRTGAHLSTLGRLIAHDIRVPMAGMKMMLSLLDEVENEQERQEIEKHLQKGQEELFQMIENLSTLMLDYELLDDDWESHDIRSWFEFALTRAGIKADLEHIDESLILKLRSRLMERVLELSRDYLESLGIKKPKVSLSLDQEDQAWLKMDWSGSTKQEAPDSNRFVQYSLKTGEGHLSAFLYLRLENLVGCCGGNIDRSQKGHHTSLSLALPLN